MSFMAQEMASPERGLGRSRRAIIVGAGPAGLALAILLRRAGWLPHVHEARSEASLAGGAFLTLAPNGMNALKVVGAAEEVAASGMVTRAIEILNGTGRRLALIDQGDDLVRCGARSITIARGRLAAHLLARARAEGVELRFGAALTGIEQAATGVTARFGDGSVATAELLAGCDGLRSATRRLAFPDAPEPEFTGLVGTGGFVEDCPVAPTDGAMRMVFGRRGFFGCIKQGDGPAYWFNSFPEDDPARWEAPDPAALARHVRSLHAGDPAFVTAILDRVAPIDRCYPVYDIRSLPRWHTGRVVLVGDAAHAISPHAGQGASLALEDAVVLAACLRAEPVPAAAFARYERLRRARVEAVVRLARRNGSRKRAQGPIGLFVRDLILPLLIPLGARAMRRVTAYRVDRESAEIRHDAELLVPQALAPLQQAIHR